MVLLQRSNFTTTGLSGKRESDGYHLRRTPSARNTIPSATSAAYGRRLSLTPGTCSRPPASTGALQSGEASSCVMAGTQICVPLLTPTPNVANSLAAAIARLAFVEAAAEAGFRIFRGYRDAVHGDRAVSRQ
jgi:hypothetical protein